MGCCKCEQEFVGWADPQPVVFAEPSDGQEYCVFHAPKDEKRKALGSEEKYTVEEFNVLVFARIAAVQERVKAGEAGAKCDLRRTVFPGEIGFGRYGQDNPLPRISFRAATFSSSAWFRGATFSGEAVFRGATFIGDAWFYKATFSGAAGFGGATFSGEARFIEATFSGGAGFFRATFSGAADFRGAKTGKDGPVEMRDMQPGSLEQLVFTRAELEAPLFSFVNCVWPGRLGLEVHGEGDAASLLECEILYRAMKQRAAGEHDQRMVSVWHAKEKEMALRRLQQGMAETTFSGLWGWVLERDGLDLHHAAERLWQRLRGRLGLLRPIAILDRLPGLLAPQRVFSATWWYSVSSGFGENPVRAMKVLLTLIVAALALVGLVEMQDDKGSPMPDVALPERLHAGLQHLLFISSPQYTPQGAGLRSALLLLTRILIPVQFGLFALAVRNRFRR